jgi:DNA-binding transcriptional ArsR family regulator
MARVAASRKRVREDSALCSRMLDVLALMSNKTRFRILCTLAEGEFCVGELLAVVDSGKFSYISQQLKILSLGGLVASRRAQRQTFYRLADPRIAQLITFLRKKYSGAAVRPRKKKGRA